MHIFSHLNELIFPSRCIACSTLGNSLCLQCSSSWSHRKLRSNLQGGKSGNLEVISSVPYSPIAQKILLAAKESGIKSADLLIGRAIGRSVQEFLHDYWIDALVPIPSRKKAVRIRGRQFVEDVLLSTSINLGIPLKPILVHVRQVRDQSGLSHSARRNNLEGAFVVENQEGFIGKALLIDDLVTTGATLSEAARALRYAGIEVVGAATAAVTLTSKIRE